MPSLVGRADDSPTPLCHIVTPVGMLGYGFDEDQSISAISRLVSTGIPTAIILDSGSTDSGPDKLALGGMSCPRTSYARDLAKLIGLVMRFQVPLIFSSAGGDGSDDHVKEMLDIIAEIVNRDEYSDTQFKTIAIFSGVDKAVVKSRLREGAITGCGKFVPQLTEEAIDQSARIVAQLGPEPFIDAMIANPDFDIIVGGRAYDPSPYIAFAAFHAQTHLKDASQEKKEQLFGAYTHMGKIMECGGQCAKPKSAGAISTIYSNGEFDVSPLDPEAACTPLSVAAHTLYEKSRPDILHGPGGYMDLTKSGYSQLSDGRSIRVSGSSFHFSRDEGLPYTWKLEAARVIGYRTIFIGSIKDPIMIAQLDTILSRIKEYVASQHTRDSGLWNLDFHVHGRDTEEIFLVGESLANSQRLATSVASTARVATIHGSYPGQKATSGNFAFGIGGKLEIEMGSCSEFSIYHLMNLENGEERLHRTSTLVSGNENGVSGEKLGIRHNVSTIGHSKSASTTKAVQASRLNSRSFERLPVSKSDVAVLYKPPPNPSKLGDLAAVLRSKNSGPYEVTFDIMFGSADVYSAVKESGMLSLGALASAFGLPEEQVVWCGFFEPALAFKVTVPRIRNGQTVPAGGFMENDVHGSQQYLPLSNMELPTGLLSKLRCA
ncbi:hypothetical protein BKA67DRAFT_204926 [Truncatella angustata]|uniref:Caib baif family enzyme n=1 Tax=Truncatella angustata TaxID=152316 RepID=A0A9P8UTG0_9PEZI|nr:uncharacterized protein BKA67DRAFT_204926 [Truncatella angustata]KAH6658033.1 hypothetical protein BKA67DRAFT_204926 [Truncatella angustata]